MNTFLVGGAIRDQLLGLDIKDKDWVVVGANIDTLVSEGYQQVRADFPVFLHPKTHEEYALARTDRKSSQGYTGFICHFTPDVTLEEDLQRRDLTINAMAQAEDGSLIDPYDGKIDLENRLLRHVSPAFVEDPLRVFRVARFAARFHGLGFRVVDETMILMKTIVDSGELDTLTPERVWIEWKKSLSTEYPDIFLSVLRECGALAVVLPEIDTLFGVFKPEWCSLGIDTGIHTLMVARRATCLTDNTCIRFAVQLHDIGKTLTQKKEEYPRHKQHVMQGARLIKGICKRLHVPNIYRDAALLIRVEHLNIHNAGELKASTFIDIFNRNDFWRKPERVGQLVLASQVIYQGSIGCRTHPYLQAQWLQGVFDAAITVDVKSIVATGLKGQAIRDELTRQRINKIAKYLENVHIHGEY
ncbi:multifunctional CCA addition/repair protein [Candidatus Enterovibrio escicola]|uniref:Multifunctional CCA protein n=1 Tax=Candidatus Enterovibrio escicola TaxID=1927127 RepID=A0A2A5SZF4_9GAMM|nr:multifunctional CCA addition/repair protein [Candidatus Enterovibrio escacola]PCS21276.1 tRNA nucleotidyltransferase [Candidatus Enterovibrio escacola]